MKKLIAKLGNMRKAVDWIVYPRNASSQDVIIQSDRRICRFDKDTGKGLLSASHNYPGFITLSLPGCQEVQVPDDVRQAALDAAPERGERIGAGVYIG